MTSLVQEILGNDRWVTTKEGKHILIGDDGYIKEGNIGQKGSSKGKSGSSKKEHDYSGTAYKAEDKANKTNSGSDYKRAANLHQKAADHYRSVGDDKKAQEHQSKRYQNAKFAEWTSEGKIDRTDLKRSGPDSKPEPYKRPSMVSEVLGSAKDTAKGILTGAGHIAGAGLGAIGAGVGLGVGLAHAPIGAAYHSVADASEGYKKHGVAGAVGGAIGGFFTGGVRGTYKATKYGAKAGWDIGHLGLNELLEEVRETSPELFN